MNVVRSAANSNSCDNAVQYTNTVTACRPNIAPLDVVIDNTLPFAAHVAQTRVFNLTATELSEDEMTTETTAAPRLTLSLHIPTAAIDFIRERYIEPARLCIQALQKKLHYQANVPLQTVIAEHMQQMTYLSPVFIPTDFNSKSDHTLLHTSYGSGSNSAKFDEHKYPHIVFYIIPYNTKAPDVIVSDVLAGNRSADQCSFVIELPQGIPLHPGAQEVSILITQWLSSIANTKLNMFLLPQNWHSWRRSFTMCSAQHERPITPVYALFGMQFGLMQVRHQFLKLSIEKLKSSSSTGNAGVTVKRTIMNAAVKHVRPQQLVTEIMQALNSIEQQ
eukprot:10236-Heterococcus_DN1.PRE.1